MTPQEEQFLQAAKQGNKAYVEGQLNNVSSDMKIAAFVYTPSIEISTYLLQYKVEINSYVYNPDKQVKVTALYKACEENYVEKVEWLIKTYTNEGETVLDCTCGSGTTLLACMNTGRNFIGIEKDEEYYKVSLERIEENKKRLRSESFKKRLF